MSVEDTIKKLHCDAEVSRLANTEDGRAWLMLVLHSRILRQNPKMKDEDVAKLTSACYQAMRGAIVKHTLDVWHSEMTPKYSHLPPEAVIAMQKFVIQTAYEASKAFVEATRPWPDCEHEATEPDTSHIDRSAKGKTHGT